MQAIKLHPDATLRVASKKQSHKQLIRKVTVFARQLMRYETDLTFSEIMWYAWDEMKKFADNYRLVKFEKVNGEVIQRVILSCNWSDIYEVKGTGRPLAPGRVLFVDAAKINSGKAATISTYQKLIIEQF